MSRKKTNKPDIFLFTNNINVLAIDNGGKYAFAEKLGVVYDSVRRWCNGDNLPDGNQLMLIHNKFGISIDWLLTGKEPRTAPNENLHTVSETQVGYEPLSKSHCPFCGDMSDHVKIIISTLYWFPVFLPV